MSTIQEERGTEEEKEEVKMIPVKLATEAPPSIGEEDDEEIGSDDDDETRS